jgi:hypothetical protein
MAEGGRGAPAQPAPRGHLLAGEVEHVAAILFLGFGVRWTPAGRASAIARGLRRSGREAQRHRGTRLQPRDENDLTTGTP